jgi:hypothetical protein
VCSSAGNSWEQGQIALANLLLFLSFSFSLLIPLNWVSKVKINSENGRHLQASGNTWTHNYTCGQSNSDYFFPVWSTLHLSMSATSPTIAQWRQLQEENCCKHQRRSGPIKQKQAKNLGLPPAYAAL